MKRTLTLALLLATFVTPAFSAVNAYMEISEGGTAYQSGGHGHIPILSFKNSALTPGETSSGRMVQGHRKWSPFVITRRLDGSSPSLRKLSTEHKPVVVKITSVDIDPRGKSKPMYTITLTGARISSYSTSSGGDRPTESISFTFQKITWTYARGGKAATDDWEAR